MNEILRRILFLPPQSSSLSRDIDTLHYFVIGATMGGAFLVTIVGAWFLIRYRQRGPVAAEKPLAATEAPPLPHGRMLALEMGIVVGLLSMFVLFWSTGFSQFVRIRKAPENSMEIYVTAKQWMWKFAYPEGGATAADLYVPAEQPIKLVMTSRDVIHSFYVPEFRLKQDVVPGRFTTMWFEARAPGVYPILCTEYCGTGHSTMRGRVIALSSESWSAWQEARAFRELPDQPEDRPVESQSPMPLAEAGRRVAVQQGCLRCHSVDGTPHIGPTWAGLYGSRVILENGESVIASGGYLTESMMDPLAKLHRGFEPVMPSYQGFLSVGETGALVEYIKSLSDVPEAPDRPPYTLPYEGWRPVPGPVRLPATATEPANRRDQAPTTLPPTRRLAPDSPPANEGSEP